MTLYRAHRVSLQAQSLAALATLVAVGAVPWAVALAFGSGILLSERLSYGRRVRPGFRQALALFALAAAVFFVFDVLFISARLSLAIAHLLPYLLFHKHLERLGDRDTWQALLVAALHPVAAAGLSDDLEQLSWLLAYVGSASWALVTFNFKRTMAPGGRPRATLLVGGRTTNVMNFTLAGPELGSWSRGLAAGAVLASLAFLGLPRFQVGFIPGLLGNVQMTAGLTRSVELTRMGLIEVRGEPVLRIESEQALPPSLRWRSVTLESFDGFRWASLARPPRLRPSAQGWFELGPTGPPELRYTVTLLPGSGPEVVAAADLTRILPPSWSRLEPIAGGGLRLSDELRPIRYQAISTPRGAGASAVDPALLDYCRRLPRLDPRVAALARSLQSGADSTPALIARIEAHLSRLGYTNRLEHDWRLDPTAEFLFQRRAGHCEQFASAAAVLLRAAGVPARLINGYQRGQPAPEARGYLVTRADAHTWVEAYLAGQGWVEFDPSPIGADQAGGAAWWRELGEWARANWDRYVILYGRADQQRLLSWLREQVHRHAFALSAAILLLLLRRRLPRRIGGAALRRPPLQRHWQELERALARHQIQVAESDTFGTLAARLAQRSPAALAALELFQGAYEAVRFGGAPLGPEVRARLRRSARSLAEAAGAS